MELAQVGRVLVNLRDADTGEVRHGWTVESVGSGEPRAEQVLLSRLHKHTDLSRKCDH